MLAWAWAFALLRAWLFTDRCSLIQAGDWRCERETGAYVNIKDFGVV